MSGRVLLLVSGSRSLAADPRAEAWAREILSAAVYDLPKGSVVVCGDAPGPDTWAEEIAWDLSYHCVVYQLDGRRRHGMAAGGRWTTEAPTRDRRWPLTRNAAMVREVASRADRYAATRCLALVDTTSRTQGTRHTVTQAQRAGIACDVREWRG